jgi:hypothetical protein
MSFFKNETEEKEKCSCEDNYAEKILIWYFLVYFGKKFVLIMERDGEESIQKL